MDPTQFDNRSKKGSCRLVKRNAPKYFRGASKHVYDIGTGDKSWIYAYEPESKQQSTVWVFQDQSNPTKVARARSSSKQMIACFISEKPLEQRRTVNSEGYTTICLPVVFQEIRKSNRRRRITLRHDNASSHTSPQTIAFLSTQNIALMSHPSYSSDLAPNDFFLFPYVKNKMRGQCFSTPEEAVDAFRIYVLEMPQSE